PAADRGAEFRLAEIVYVRTGCRRIVGPVSLPDEGSDALPALDVALLGQIGKCPSHGDAGHPELIAKRLLGRQRVAGSDSAPGYLVMQHQEELAMQRHPRPSSHP